MPELKTTKAELVQMLIDKNIVLIKWLEIIANIDDDCIEYGNAQGAKKLIKDLEVRNTELVSVLVEMAKECEKPEAVETNKVFTPKKV